MGGKEFPKRPEDAPSIQELIQFCQATLEQYKSSFSAEELLRLRNNLLIPEFEERIRQIYRVSLTDQERAAAFLEQLKVDLGD
jgi:hypothetical protein